MITNLSFISLNPTDCNAATLTQQVPELATWHINARLQIIHLISLCETNKPVIEIRDMDFQEQLGRIFIVVWAIFSKFSNEANLTFNEAWYGKRVSVRPPLREVLQRAEALRRKFSDTDDLTDNNAPPAPESRIDPVLRHLLRQAAYGNEEATRMLSEERRNSGNSSTQESPAITDSNAPPASAPMTDSDPLLTSIMREAANTTTT